MRSWLGNSQDGRGGGVGGGGTGGRGRDSWGYIRQGSMDFMSQITTALTLPRADMMSQHAALSGFFSDEPFFSRGEKLLWPLQREGVPSLKPGFFSQRAKLVDSLLKELHDGPHPFSLPLVSCAVDRCVQCAFN